MQDTLSSKNITIRSLLKNPIDAIWDRNNNRPLMPQAPLRIHPIQYAGKNITQKIADIRNKMNEVGAQSLLLTSLDQIAWVFNLRGSDVPRNPVFYSYALITTGKCYIHII